MFTIYAGIRYEKLFQFLYTFVSRDTTKMYVYTIP